VSAATQPAPVKEAAAEVISGEPKDSARAWLGPLTLVVAILFALDTYLVATQPLQAYDIPITTWVQSANWGPVTYFFELTNNTAGYIQGAVAIVVIVVMFIWERRAGYLMAIGAISSLLDNLIKTEMARSRPTPDLVHILTPAPGYSYPSGHAVYFTWMSFMIAFALAPHIRPGLRWIPWVTAGIVIVLACTARVWAGDHWPSDVAGGFLLALGWSAFVMWIPERWLPSPSWHWFRGRMRPT
jgi:undecaprenyl-diphosphatase